MNPILTALLAVVPAAVVTASSVICRRYVRRGGSTKRATLSHIAAALVAGILVCSLALAVSAEGSPADAEVGAEAAPVAGFAAGMAYIAAALVTGLSGIGGGIAVAAGAPAAIGATSEDPKAFGKALIFVALGEGIALYGLLVSILILSKV